MNLVPSPRPPRPATGGFSLPELLVVLVIVGLALLFVVPAWAKISRRIALESTTSGIARLLNLARVQAITRGVQTVVEVTQSGTTGSMELTACVDTDGDFACASTEPRLGSFRADTGVRLWKRGGAIDDLASAVPMDGYGGVPGRRHRAVYGPTGALVPPEDSTASGPPSGTGGRGIYLADRLSFNFFRVTFYSEATGKPIAEKWVDSAGSYGGVGWVWR